MQAIMPDRREFVFHISTAGNLHRVYLYSLVSILKPKKVVELGTGTGVSAAFMMEALPPESTLVTIEIRELDFAPDSPWRFDHLKPWEKDPRLVRVRGDVLDQEIHGQIDGVELLYMDTVHSSDQLSREWKIYFPKMAPRGVILMDDIHMNEDIQRFWDAIQIPKFDTGKVIHDSGFGLVLV